MATPFPHSSGPSASVRPQRRRSMTRNNKEEMENQRMNHIAIERNRRKQMNQSLSVLRSLMPHSYVQRGDQTSIVGGAINFVKELEQKLQWLSTEKEVKQRPNFDFFKFPQFSTSSSSTRVNNNSIPMNESTVEIQPTIADIEVNVTEKNANFKIRWKRLPPQLLKLVSGLNDMSLTILHLNLTSDDRTVLYSLSLRITEEEIMSVILSGEAKANSDISDSISTSNRVNKRQRCGGVKGNSSQFKGVMRQKNGQWGAQLYSNHTRIWLGTFRSEIDAAMAYDRAAVKFRTGDTHRNFPWTGIKIEEPMLLSHYSAEAVLNMIRDGSYQYKFMEYIKARSRINAKPDVGINSMGNQGLICNQLSNTWKRI
ncbi:Transcription factor bHLH94 [Hibiscus syriacus]|uniref:Transcription factor bHLH94 n=1 Tax=Hibiscus syriacus TaxID=106335 RepID=A0A6A3ARP1_HIBSY|nr:Transcription factor bHLH94 [Hibiscus syriacus]